VQLRLRAGQATVGFPARRLRGGKKKKKKKKKNLRIGPFGFELVFH
jgi:hypothetical protein